MWRQICIYRQLKLATKKKRLLKYEYLKWDDKFLFCTQLKLAAKRNTKISKIKLLKNYFEVLFEICKNSF